MQSHPERLWRAHLRICLCVAVWLFGAALIPNFRSAFVWGRWVRAGTDIYLILDCRRRRRRRIHRSLHADRQNAPCWALECEARGRMDARIFRDCPAIESRPRQFSLATKSTTAALCTRSFHRQNGCARCSWVSIYISFAAFYCADVAHWKWMSVFMLQKMFTHSAVPQFRHVDLSHLGLQNSAELIKIKSKSGQGFRKYSFYIFWTLKVLQKYGDT